VFWKTRLKTIWVFAAGRQEGKDYRSFLC
jgi:hypothetical protein